MSRMRDRFEIRSYDHGEQNARQSCMMHEGTGFMTGTPQPWPQVYDPLHNATLSTLCAALPVVVLLGALAFLHMKAHWAALLGLGSALLVAIFVFGMPPQRAMASAAFGAAYGLLPIGWIILNVIFLYNLTQQKGLFEVLKESL